MDSEPCKQSTDAELLTSEVTEGFKESALETVLDIQKSTGALDGNKSETLLLQVISILESLDSDITNSLKISRKNMYLPKIPGLRSRCNSITEEETGTVAESAEETGTVAEGTGSVAESALSTSPEKIGTTAKKNPIENSTESACFTCLYFGQMDNIYKMQEGLIVIRRDLGQIVKELLVHCNAFKCCAFRDIESVLDEFNDILKEREDMERDFKQGGFFHLISSDAIGAIRLSSQMMYYKYLLLENDKYIQTFKLAQFLMTQLMRGRIYLQKEEASSCEMKEV